MTTPDQPGAAGRDAAVPAITVAADGPYLVEGPLPVARRRAVYSEHGEPMTWQTTERLEDRARYALCRCGQSSAKPYCDGTHARIGFDGSEQPPGEDYDRRAKPYPGTRIVVRDDRGLCVHAGFCGNRVTNVWKMVRGDSDESTVRAQVMAMVERCPSGALTYRLEADGPDVEPELPTEVVVVDDGPLWVTGSVTVTTADGTTLERRNRMTLCRCGGSSQKPYCDGTHKERGFTDR
jgi:CDGSH-type Zn-finger protein